ncbi:MAG: DUF6130 family protein [Nostoc sp.]|uniref:DUF6130 family protein n=2 Tax=Nostoc sp. TaxID=1180 RepID=UPI002FF358B7
MSEITLFYRALYLQSPCPKAFATAVWELASRNVNDFSRAMTLRCFTFKWIVILKLLSGTYLPTMNSHTLSARDIIGSSPLIAIENEAPPKLIVDPPLPEPLAQGRVFIQYRTENLRVLPVFGKGALEVSPRIGHIHITVDDAPWHFVDSSGETIILVGLEPGVHKVLIELADPTHKVITSETVEFTLPDPKKSS